MKIYLDIDVLSAAKKRMATVFDEMDRICVSFSGGKDSLVLLHLAHQEALRRDRVIDVLFLDWEAQYTATIRCIEQNALAPNLNMWWVCLPISTSNEASVIEPIFTAWDPARRDVWVRDFPTHDCVITDYSHFPFYSFGMTFEDFVNEFGEWYGQLGGNAGQLIGLRTQESIHRWRAIKKGRFTYQKIQWSTTLTDSCWNFYPIYDWSVDDVWHYTAANSLPYNHAYDLMYLHGMSVHDMRINEPYALEARRNMGTFRYIEPEMWAKMTGRTAGANFSARRGNSELFNHMRRAGCPKGMTWKEYSLQLLQDMPEPLQAHYWRRIRVFVEWFEKNEGWDDLKEESDSKLEAKKLGGSWRMVAHTLLKNDFFCLGLSFSINQDEFRKYHDLVAAWEAGEEIDLPPTPDEARGVSITTLLKDSARMSARRKAPPDKLAELKERYKGI